MSVFPNFQFVLSRLNLYGGLCGSNENTTAAISWLSIINPAKIRCMRLEFDS
jgi:hypothetical protein